MPSKTAKVMMIALGSCVLAVLFFLILIVLSRFRHAHILRQMEERAIAPLVELQKRAQLVGMPMPANNLSYNAPEQNLLAHGDVAETEFVIPETQSVDPLGGIASDISDDDFSTDMNFAPAPPKPAKTAAPKDKPKPPKIPEAVVEASSDDDDFMMAFGDEDRNKKRVSTLPKSPGPEDTSVPHEEEEIVFGFDDTFSSPPEHKTQAPITATEIPQVTSEPEEIVFSFDDVSSSKPAAQSTTKPKAPSAATKDSIYESIPLDDLDLVLSSPSLSEGTATGSSSQEMTNPMSDLDLNLDFKLDGPITPSAAEMDTVALPSPFSSSHTGAASTNGALYRMDLTDDTVGKMPATWTGEATDYASLTIVADGAGKCIQYKKTKGEGPTSFGCSFPQISGRLSVEFDIRCDEKNKHLLGFYIEKDSDFRRSVHTVVQCIDMSRPAYLRIFTKPTPYTLSSWRHVKYVIDLPKGLVDGYVDSKLVAEGVRMGTKPIASIHSRFATIPNPLAC